MTEMSYSEPSPFSNAVWSLRRMPGRVKSALVRLAIRAVVRLVGDTNSIRHAKRELAAALTSKEDGPDRWMAHGLIELLAVFSSQGHSGFSAPWCAESLRKLAMFEPLGPLTGEENEWMEVGTGVFQNVRCGHVFKQANVFDGQAYDLDGRIFREPNGSCYTNGNSRVPVTFPYTPKREYVDVPAVAA